MKMSNLYNVQKDLIEDDCMIVTDVDYDDIDEEGVIIKSVFNRDREYHLIPPRNCSENNINDEHLQQFVDIFVLDVEVFKIIGNKIYLEIMVDSKTKADVKYLISAIRVEVGNVHCPKCGKPMGLNIYEKKPLPNTDAKCIKCRIECMHCHEALDLIKFNAALFFANIAQGLRYSDIFLNVKVGYNVVPNVEIIGTTNLPKRYFTC